MPTFQITIVNDTFAATSEETVDDLGAAKLSALKGALELGMEQLLGGKPLFGAEVTVGHGVRRDRFIVSMSISALK